MARTSKHPIDAAVHVLVAVNRTSVGAALLLGFIVYVLHPLLAASVGLVEAADAWPAISLGLAVIIVFGTIAWAGASNRIGALATFACNALVIVAIWNIGWDKELVPGGLPLYTAFKWAWLVLVVLGGFNGIATFVFMCFTSKNRLAGKGAYVRRMRGKARDHARQLVVAAILVPAFLLVGLASQSPGLATRTVRITPGSHHAGIAFWAAFANTTYTPAQLQALDDHDATLVIYHPPNIKDAGQRQYFLDMMTWYNLTYPNIRFVMSIQGYVRIANESGDPAGNWYYNTFPYDGSAEGFVNYSKQFMDLAAVNNLSNFIGVNTDQEAPDKALLTEHGIVINPDPARNLQARAMLNDLFTWRDANHPEMLVTSTNGMKAVLDPFDGDWDMHVIDRSNILDVPWDEIAPMIYRCSGRGPKPYGYYPIAPPGNEGRPSSWIYHQLNFLNKSLHAANGNADQLGIYLGITNLSCYGAGVQQFENGEMVGYGYDQIVKDALIAKHFGSKIITIFILNTVLDGYSMGGVFDSYGDDFLDRFMEDINGINSTTPFDLPIRPDYQLLKPFQQDLLYNIDRPAELVAVLLCIVAIVIFSVLLHPEMKRKLQARRTA